MGASQRSSDDDDDAPMAEINVTPLVDVMLVLLIVFMIAAPLMTAGVPVDLPKAQAEPLTDQKAPLAVTINGAGHYFITNEEVPPELLLSSLKNQAENELDRRIHVRADKELPYRVVLEVMGQISTAGFTKVALVSEAPKGAAPQTAPVDGGAPQAAAGVTPASLSGGGEAVAGTPAAATAPAAPAAVAAPPAPAAAAAAPAR